jgi:transcriptional regulator with XRE-family HTH domain
MENVVMSLCRTTHNLTQEQIATRLGLKTEEYSDLETGAIVMQSWHADVLSDVYDIDQKYFLESAQQLDLLLGRAELIKKLQAENKILQADNMRFKKFAEITYDLLGLMQGANDVLDKNMNDERKTTPQLTIIN